MSTAAAAAEAPVAPKGKKKLIVIIAAAVLLLVAAAAVALLLMKKQAVGDGDDEDLAQVETSEARSPALRDAGATPTFVALEPFTVNLADREVERYAQVVLTLELDDAKTEAQVKAYMPAIRNNILLVLAHKTSAQILDHEGKLRLAGEIQRASSRALGVEVEEPENTGADEGQPRKKRGKRKSRAVLPVVAVHFSNFIVQ
ncbi:MAG TPA: flagellar basal body-associated FliL family protein [Rubrivivax sp.]|nr:flagellar basal body-associated FliL family protein [Rubrivivax sp.]